MIKIAPLVAEEIESKDLYVACSAFHCYIYWFPSADVRPPPLHHFRALGRFWSTLTTVFGYKTVLNQKSKINVL